MSAHHCKISLYCTVCVATYNIILLPFHFVVFCVSLISALHYKIISYCKVCVANISTSLENQFVLYCMCHYVLHIIAKSFRCVLYVSLTSVHHYKIISYSTVCVAVCKTLFHNHFVLYSCVAMWSTLLQNQFVLYCMCSLCQHIITKSVVTVLYVSLCVAHLLQNQFVLYVCVLCEANYYKISSYCTVCVAMWSTLLQNQFVHFCMCRYVKHIIKKSVRILLFVSLCEAHYYKISSYITLCVAMWSTLLQNQFVLYSMCRYVKHIITKSVQIVLHVLLCVAHYYKISSYVSVCVSMWSTLLQNQFVLYCMCRYV
jgi:hypothetical protein